MGVHDFNDLNEHVGHPVKVQRYIDLQGEPVNVAIECIKCNAVLIDFDREPDEDMYETLEDLVADELDELDQDFLSMDDEELVECREAMHFRVQKCLEALGRPSVHKVQAPEGSDYAVVQS